MQPTAATTETPPPNDDPDCRAAETGFRAANPGYAASDAIDALRARDYARLDRLGHTYLDYTGGGLFADSQIEKHLTLLRNTVLGNPHSDNPTSAAATELVEGCRAAVLRYFNANPDEYVAIFTPNASGALRLIGESYPFDDRGHYLLTYDNHNSVNGIREYAHRKGASVTYVPLLRPSLRIHDDQLDALLAANYPGGHKLFAFPAQSNFSGAKHPLTWVERAQAHGWDVLLDAAAFVPTNPLDLSAVKPDFVDLSFYKMFGYPTGIGALLARRPVLEKLARPWFAGGTVSMASVNTDSFRYVGGAAQFEDGTVDYLGIPAVEIGLQHLQSVGVETVQSRVSYLVGWLLRELQALRHSNGAALVQVYGPSDNVDRGGTISLNFYASTGNLINHRYIEQQANARRISLRNGAFCNPGTGEIALGLAKSEYLECHSELPGALDDFDVVIDPREMGALRVSLGLVSNFADVWRFVQFARSLLN